MLKFVFSIFILEEFSFLPLVHGDMYTINTDIDVIRPGESMTQAIWTVYCTLAFNQPH